MKHLIIILALTWPWLASAQDVRFRGTSDSVNWITLPSGYFWEEHQGIDSFPGKIFATNGVTINFDLLLMAGAYLTPNQSNTCVWYKEETTDFGILMRSALVTSNKVLITFPQSFANFWCDFTEQRSAEITLSIVRSFNPSNFVIHLENRGKK